MKPKEEDPKEMVGGCCVCADENGWTENPLVYCDGQGCNVAVHQACYGIVTVPTGSWYCRKCESQERSARVRCELCPSKNGALKRTDSGGWAHVVCALYIPEVRFGNVTTMEPIMLQLVPPERFNKSCYICEENCKEGRATIGACMQCNKAGCKQHFHVICAQAMGLLCEEAGNYLDNVKYCGYCQYHYAKLLPAFQRKGSHVKTIPPYRPVSFEAISSDEESSSANQESRDLKLKKRLTKPGSVGETSSKVILRDIKSSNGEGNISSKLADSTTESKGIFEIENKESSPVTAKSENKIIESLPLESSVPNSTISTNQNLKHTPQTSKSVTPTVSTFSTTSVTHSVPVVHNTVSTINSVVTSSSMLPALAASSVSANTSSGNTTSTTTSSAPVVSSQNNTSVASVTTHSFPFIHTSVVTTVSSTISSRPRVSENTPPPTSQPALVSLSESNLDKDKKKMRRSGPRSASGSSNFGDTDSVHSNEDNLSKDFPSNNDNKTTTDNTRLQSSPDDVRLNVQFTPNVSAQSNRSDPLGSSQIELVANESAKRSRNQERGRRSKRGTLTKRGRLSGGAKESNVKESRDSGASSPESFTSDCGPPSKRGRNKKLEAKDEKSISNVITNGLNASTLLLGNQINPSSAVAQKFADTLNAELEAHSVYKEEEKFSNALIGPALPGKRETSTPGASIGSIQPPPLPQSLEQLLERQWEQGSQFLMEQAQHFDIASLLSCLHQLRQENARLEDTVTSLIARRDHLLAVNARLSVPLATSSTSSSTLTSNNIHPITTSSSSGPPSTVASVIGSHISHSGNSVSHSSGPPLPTRPHSQGRHPSGGNSHPSTPGGATVVNVRGASPHDRRGVPTQITLPLENGLGEPEYRYRGQAGSGDHQHRQQSPMLPPSANPTTLRQSPASSSYHSSSSPHTVVPSLSPSNASHAPSHTLVTHAGLGHTASLVSTSHGPTSLRAVPDHSRAELVRLSSGQPHSNPSVGYPVYQMVSPPVPGPHHSPVGLSQHPPHAQVMRREVVDSSRGNTVSSIEKR